jgi:hypothetical protein
MRELAALSVVATDTMFLFFFEQQQIQCLVLGRSGEALGYFIEGQIGIQKKIMIEMY